MEIVKIILLICIGILFPAMTGALAAPLFCGQKHKESWKEWYVGGCLIYGAFLAVVSFVCTRTQISFEKSAMLILAGSIMVVLICALFLVFSRGFRKRIADVTAEDVRKPFRARICMLCAFLLVAGVYFVRPFALGDGFDTPERVVSILDTGRLSGVNVLTGEESLLGAVQGVQTDYLPLFYACLCKWTGLSPVKVLFDVVPLLVLLQAFCVIALFAEYFFGDEQKEKATVLLLFALVTICGSGAYMNTSYGLLCFPYEAMTIFSSVLLPLAVLLAMSRKSPVMLLLTVAHAVCLGGIPKGVVILFVSMVCLWVSGIVGYLMRGR